MRFWIIVVSAFLCFLITVQAVLTNDYRSFPSFYVAAFLLIAIVVLFGRLGVKGGRVMAGGDHRILNGETISHPEI